METTHQTNYDIFMENFSEESMDKKLLEFKNLFESELVPLVHETKKIKAGVVLDAFKAWNEGRWNEFMEQTKQTIKGDDTNE